MVATTGPGSQDGAAAVMRPGIYMCKPSRGFPSPPALDNLPGEKQHYVSGHTNDIMISIASLPILGACAPSCGQTKLPHEADQSPFSYIYIYIEARTGACRGIML